MGISVDTLQRRREDDPHFAEVFAKSQAEGKRKILAAQWEHALKGNTALLIWLGKNYLNQTEPKQTAEIQVDVNRVLTNLADVFSEIARRFVDPSRYEELEQYIRGLDGDLFSSTDSSRPVRPGSEIH